MNSLPYEGVRVLVLGNGPRVGKARQLLSEGGALLSHHFSSSVTYVVIDRTVSPSSPQVVAARRAAIPVVTTSELQAWPGMEALSAIRFPPPQLPVMVGPAPYYAAQPLRANDFTHTDTTVMALGWGAMPLLTGGVAMPFVAAVAARRLGSRDETVLAVGYGGALALAAVGFTLGVITGSGFLLLISLFVWVCCWLGGSVHAFLLYEKVARSRRNAADDDRPVVSDPRNAQALAAIEHRRKLRSEARQLAERDPHAARELGIGRPDRRRDYNDGGLVDVNGAPASALAELPGVTDAVADQIVRYRELSGPFESTSDIVVHTDIEPRFVDRFDEVALYMRG